MHIIKLNAIDSTNLYLRQLNTEKTVSDFTVVVAKHQTKGRGQMGTTWTSENAKNLMFSVFKEFTDLDVKSHFYLSMAVSLAVFKALSSFKIGKLKIKWPNDILSEEQKVCGILIENVIKGSVIQSSIIGIGVNVNQTEFYELPNATSMQQVTGTSFNLDHVLQEVLQFLKHYLSLVEAKSYSLLKTEYEHNLFRRHAVSSFKEKSGNVFTGSILGVTKSGFLEVKEDATSAIKCFELKEVQLLY